MQKSMKRLLSVLAVLALVLTMAPAGILAVETKAEGTEPVVVPGQANWAAAPAGAAAIQSAIDEAKAIQEAAKTALTDGTCPACGGATVTWEPLAGGTAYTRPAAGGKYHYYIQGDFSSTAANILLGNDLTAGDSICLLLVNANANVGGRFLFYAAAGGATFNVMGTGTVHSTGANVDFGLISNTGANTINLYGGTFTTDAATLNEAVIYMTSPKAVTNIWTNDVVIGHATVPTATCMNVNLNNGTLNMYAGTIRNGYTTAQNQGGNVFIYGNSDAVLNMYGGTISGGAGGNGCIGTNVHCRGTVNMYGGEIKNGQANSYQAGGQVSVSTGVAVDAAPAVIPTFNMYGGKISGGVNTNGSAGQGGNVNIAGSHANADAKVGYGKMLVTGTALIEGGTALNGNGGNIEVARGGELEMTGGTIAYGLTSGNNAKYGGAIALSTGATAKISGGTISGCKASTQGGNIYAATGSDLIITGGTIENGSVSGGTGGNIYLKDDGTGTTISGATITGGKTPASHGGNLFINGGKVTLEETNTITKGDAYSNGGNIYVNASTKLTVKCDLTDGHANQAGNIYIDGADTEVTLDGATLSGGTIKVGGTLQTNGRVNSGTLILKNGVNCSGGVLFLDSATSKLHVDSSFSGDFTLWQNGAQAVPGTAVRNATCNGAFTGLVRNGNWAVAEDYWVSVGMAFDGTSGLKYPAQGVVYNGAVTPAASSQDAVDAYIAAMADEEVEVKPQYVMIDGNVNIGDAEVAIWTKGDITVSGTGTVYGVDRANDAYDANGGSITADGVTVAEEVTAGGRRYIALSDATVDANKYTFHRVETKLTNVTVNVANAGIYYKAEYQFDEIVKDRIASYGVNVNLEGSTKEGQTSSSDMSIYDAESHTLTAKSHGVYGIFKDTNLASTNKENGQIKLCGNPYLAIDTTGNMESSDCPEFTAAESTKMSLADAMEMANEKWEVINEEGKPMLKEFFTKWLEAGAWDAEWAAKLTNLIPAEA